MCNALNALGWDELFGSHKINRLLESNVLQATSPKVDPINMGFHGRQLRQTKTAFSLLKRNQLQNTKMQNVKTKLRTRQQNIHSLHQKQRHIFVY
jgi:hypothetical protein